MTALLPPVDLPSEPVNLPVKALRHKWDRDNIRSIHARESPTNCEQTERHCLSCGLFMLTIHPPKGIPFRMWRWGDDGKQFKAGRTPVCQPRAGT